MPASPRTDGGEELVAVALSGGVDSAVAAYLLKREGRRLVGFFLRNGISAQGPGARRSCCSLSDAADARRVADRLDIPFYTLDVEAPFRAIVERFVEDYRSGRTPNPCVQCNNEVKFGRLLEIADSIGASRVATGHYARIERKDGRARLFAAADAAKDQSYVLGLLARAQIERALFPLGPFKKEEVRRIAREAGLPVADKPESQEICFVPGGDYRQVVRQRAPEAFEEGPIVTLEGRVVGRHRGTGGFTIGQRRGLGVALGERYHVVRIDPESRTVYVGRRGQACASGFLVDRLNFLGADADAIGDGLDVWVRIRHRHRGSAGRLVRRPEGWRVDFEKPQFAVTPGQAAVLYDREGGEVLAGGWIREAVAETLPEEAT